tara:strand:- start:1814 stop:3937 length:2124 start_codon:yes stop_codon:yes gene_type:complete
VNNLRTNRTEEEIFKDLEELCTSKSYFYTIAYFCLRDNVIKYRKKFSKEEVLQQFNPNRLVRTEISTLIGLGIQNEINLTIPTKNNLLSSIKETEELLQELHFSMLTSEKGSDSNIPFFPSIQNRIKESVFYSGEGVYLFQYKEFSKIKFKNDNQQLKNKFGFNISDVYDVFEAIELIQDRKLNNFQTKNIESKIFESLECFKFTLDEVARNSKKTLEIVERIINKFICNLEELTAKFTSLTSFNPYNAFPIIELEKESFLCFQIYSLYESLYETPVFLLNEDKKYSPIASKNRGNFTENFCIQKLTSVFGPKRVYNNIEIIPKKGEILSEIDILILYGDIAIIVQAKSKRLTIESKKGNLSTIQSDFKLAIQDAYDQAAKTAIAVLNPKEEFRNSQKEPFIIENKIRKVYPIIILSDYYPSLTIQTREFLELHNIPEFSQPFITDIFNLDIICDFLRSPLYCLSYIDRRSNYLKQIYLTHELTSLSVHLSHNLWVENKYEGVFFTEDCTAELDAAVLSRKYNLPGSKTPKGILTKFKDTQFKKIIQQLDQGESIQQIELGLFLLKLSEETVLQINSRLDLIFKQTLKDRQTHDFSMGFEDLNTGITFHSSFNNLTEAKQTLEMHCVARKYKSKMNKMFGIFIHPISNIIGIILYLNDEWTFSPVLEDLSKDLKEINEDSRTVEKKVLGRNSLCPCGSGKKYKKCCL